MQPFTVRAYECSPRGKLSIRSLFHYFEEAAWNSSHNLGFSVDHLKEHNQSWVLYRLDCHIYNLPVHGDTVSMDTWPSGAGRFFAYRDFKLYDSKGGLIVEGTSAWLIFNLSSRKMEPIPDKLKQDDFFESRDNLARPERKLSMPSDFSKTRSIQVRKQDLDRNNHVNNVSLIQFMIEMLPLDIDESSIRKVEILFKSELLWGDQLVASHHAENGWLHVQLALKGDDKVIALGRLKFI